jgi:hypothetical protein
MKIMSKNDRKSNNQVNQIFDDLEDFLNFCRLYGYKFDEAELYSNRSFAFRQFTKFMQGKPFKDMWALDSKNV